MTAFENHKGLPFKDILKAIPKTAQETGKKSYRKNLYLGQSKERIRDGIMFGKNKLRTFKTLPILKNGNRSDLQFVNISKCKLSFIHTCPYDSLFQVFLCMIADYPHFYEYVTEKIESDPESVQDKLAILFLSSAMAAYQKPINSSTYTSRGKIMLNYKNVTISSPVMTVNCATQIDNLYNYICSNRFSLDIRYDCPNDRNHFRDDDQRKTIIININHFKNRNYFKNYILNKSCIPAGLRKCNKCRDLGDDITSTVTITCGTYKKWLSINIFLNCFFCV